MSILALYFSFTILLSEFSVLDNIMLPALKLKQKSKDEIEHEAMELIKLLDIEGQEFKKGSKFQGGNSNG
jgi:lipoprotein-releasing system ATP-binding protein